MNEHEQTPASKWEPKEVNGKVYVPLYTEAYGVPTVYWQTYEDLQQNVDFDDSDGELP